MSDKELKTSTWWCADFETTSEQNLIKDGHVRVWLWSLVGVEKGEKYHGFTIESFLHKVKSLHCKRVFFHNLKFDGRFIIDYFNRSGKIYGVDYSCIIDGLGSWYEISWQSHTRHKVKFWDSLKKFPGTSVAQLGKFIGLPKLDKPYFDRYYPEDYKPSQEEIDYCIRDSEVVAKAIMYDMEQGYTSMTLASDCFKWARDTCLGGYQLYRDYMPRLEQDVDEFCRESYRGGISYLKPEYEDIEIHDIKVFDVNSLYPWVMHDCPLPVGYGIWSEDLPTNGLYIVHIKAEFAIKQNKFPFLQIKGNPKYNSNQFISYSNGIEDLWLTSVDYKNFKNNYKILDSEFVECITFDSRKGLLAPHVDYWMEKKKYYQEKGMPFMRYIAKTFMNGFYGKTALRPQRLNVVPELDPETNQMSYANKVISETEPIYIPYGTFVTAWARDKLINSALKIWDDFVYCDTDSIHCFARDSYPLDIHPTDLGKWKDETEDKPYEYARYIKQKTYCHARPKIVDGKLRKEVVEIRAAGLSTESRSNIDIDDFKYGLVIKNANLKTKTVPGGALLEKADWSLDKKDYESILNKLLEGEYE